MTRHINITQSFLPPLHAPLHSGRTAFPCLLPPAFQLLSQAAYGFCKAPLLQEALQDCSEEPAWLCLDSRWPFLCLFPFQGSNIKEEDCDVPPWAAQGPERVSHFPKVSPQTANILPPTSLSPITLSFSWMLCLPFPSSSSFFLPLGLHPSRKTLKRPTSLLWDGPGENCFKHKGVASAGLPRPRTRALRWSSSSVDCGGIRYSNWYPPLHPVSGGLVVV